MFVRDLVAFWYGAPWVINVDAWLGVTGLTPWVNRGICLMMAPYQLIMSAFFIASVVDILKGGMAHVAVFEFARLTEEPLKVVTSWGDYMVHKLMVNPWRTVFPSSDVENFENATGDFVAKIKEEAAKMNKEKAAFNENCKDVQSNFPESEDMSTDMPTTYNGRLTSSCRSGPASQFAAVSLDTPLRTLSAESQSESPDNRVEMDSVVPEEDDIDSLSDDGNLVKDHQNGTKTYTKEALEQCQLSGSSFCERATKVVEQTPGTWKIYDREFDLTPFMDKHPGGKWALQLAQNSDCTVLFESYHVMITRDKLEKMMKPYEVTPMSRRPPEGAPLLPPEDEMYGELKQMARDYFKGKKKTLGGQPHKMTWERGLWWLSMLLISWYFNYRLLFYSETWYIVLAPISWWLCGGGLSHECGHFAAFSNPTLNWFVGMLGGCPLVFNTHAWAIQHTVQHHQFTNTYADVDLFHFLPLVRTSRQHTKWDWVYQYQWWLIFFLIPTTSGHLSFAVPMDLLLQRPVFVGPLGDSEMTAQEKHVLRYGQCAHLRSIMKVLHKPMMLEVSLAISWFLTMISVLGLYKAFLYYTMMMMTASWLFIIFTQGAHLNEDAMTNVQGNCKMDEAGTNSNGKEMTLQGFYGQDSFETTTFTSSNLLLGRWVREQIAYTVDFCPDSWCWFYLSGGLSMQTLHHVLPGISHVHLFHMYPEFKRICKKHGVEVRMRTSFFDFCGGFATWLMDLSIEDSVYAQRDRLDWANDGKKKHE